MPAGRGAPAGMWGSSMKLMIPCALLSSFLAGYAAFHLMPDTPAGTAAAFGLWLLTMYPVDRLAGLTKQQPSWHHWIGWALSVVLVWIAYTLFADVAISDHASLTLNILVAAFVIGSLIYHFWKKQHNANRHT